MLYCVVSHDSFLQDFARLTGPPLSISKYTFTFARSFAQLSRKYPESFLDIFRAWCISPIQIYDWFVISTPLTSIISIIVCDIHPLVRFSVAGLYPNYYISTAPWARALPRPCCCSVANGSFYKMPLFCWWWIKRGMLACYSTKFTGVFFLCRQNTSDAITCWDVPPKMLQHDLRAFIWQSMQGPIDQCWYITEIVM